MSTDWDKIDAYLGTDLVTESGRFVWCLYVLFQEKAHSLDQLSGFEESADDFFRLDVIGRPQFVCESSG